MKLDNIIMLKLKIRDNNIDDFINCDPSKVISLNIFVSSNIELILNNLHKFVTLQELRLFDSNIT